MEAGMSEAATRVEELLERIAPTPASRRRSGCDEDPTASSASSSATTSGC